MTPRVIKHWGTYVAIAMSLPKSIAKDRFCLSEWQNCYGEDTSAGKIWGEAKRNNAYITDVCINWLEAEFHFKIQFASKSSAPPATHCHIFKSFLLNKQYSILLFIILYGIIKTCFGILIFLSFKLLKIKNIDTFYL